MKKKKKISIIDYGVGNLRSLIRAFEYFGSDVAIVEDASLILQSDAIVLPGDGAFKAGIRGLAVRNLTAGVLDFAKAGKPLFGICLGAQILMSDGYEFGHCGGLALIDGKVIKFPKLAKWTKIPQIGWNSLTRPKGKRWEGSLLDKIKPGSNVYFIHSYIMEPKNNDHILAMTEYGGYDFASVIAKGNILGCQFHPEKSATVGLAIIKNFIDLMERKHV